MRMTGTQVESMVRFEDEHLIVVHKPPFLAVETKNPRQQDLVSILKNRRAIRAEEPYIGLVHRLDQPVEGLLVLAKTPRAAGRLSAGLSSGDFTKEYLAVAVGVTPEKGTLVHMLKKDGRTNRSSVVCAGTSGGKEAKLSYERLAVADEKSLLVIRLDTGRHHQIRVQLAAISHPLCGDEKYGGALQAGIMSQDYTGAAAGAMSQAGAGANRGHREPLALCSHRLSFVHPASGAQMEFYAKPTGAGFACFSEWI